MSPVADVANQDPTPQIVLLSGGLDSATVLWMARAQRRPLYALSFAYGQRQSIELQAARELAAAAGCHDHKVAQIDLRLFGGSALTADLPVPKDRPAAAAGVPVTYVPARNTIFLSYALAWAEVLGAGSIALGVNAVDYSGYPDCRPAFLQAFERLAAQATCAGLAGRAPRLSAPLLHLSKAEIITAGTALGVPYGRTHSCYDPVGELACGRCDACGLRRQGFAAAGVADPTRYVAAGAAAAG